MPLDGSQRTESVLPTAARIAHAYGAELVLVHVVHEPLPTAVLRSDEDLDLACAGRVAPRASARRPTSSGLRAGLVRDGVVARTRVVRHPNQRQCILEIAQHEQAD